MVWTEAHKTNDELFSWGDIAGSEQWGSLLLGNGGSMAVWDRFGYASLFDAASQEALAHPLDTPARNLFGAFSTRNFEAVLDALARASTVCGALGQPSAKGMIDASYNSIKLSLVDAVHFVHPEWQPLFDAEILKRIRAALLDYATVYSTNYDLLVYWGRMSEDDGDGFVDYFWENPFNPRNADLWTKATAVLHLHGGLHLYRSWDGRTHKVLADADRNLLERFGDDWPDNAVPLCITEGTPAQKLAAIFRSDYLGFAYTHLRRNPAPLVLFGHSVSKEHDGHIIEAIRDVPSRTIAASVRVTKGLDVVERKHQVYSSFPHARIYFYDASTHPLGSDELKLAQPPA